MFAMNKDAYVQIYIYAFTYALVNVYTRVYMCLNM